MTENRSNTKILTNTIQKLEKILHPIRILENIWNTEVICKKTKLETEIKD